jgi:hypothetical protein
MKSSKSSVKSGNTSFSRNDNEQNAESGDIYDQDQKNAVFVNGQSLQYILKDETLQKLFLTLCSLCSLIVGSSVTAYQKRDLT